MSKNYLVKKVNNYPIIGEVLIKSTKEIVGLIFHDSLLRYKKASQCQGERIIHKTTGKDAIAITINDNYKKLFDLQPNIFEAVVMHELGHLVCGHFQKNDTMDERGKAILNNEVDSKEIEADLFALKEVGKQKMIKHFEWSINNRRNLENDNPLYKKMAIDEYENRLKFIKNYKE